MSTVDSSVLRLVVDQSARVLETYRIDSGLIQEHANGERRIKEGGYGERQVYELVQNGADELRNDPGGKIAVILTKSHLYCANQGSPITAEGVDTILRMGVSRKRGGQIGRFGVGVKSVLSVTDMPEFFSKEDDRSFGFDRDWSARRIREVQPDAEETPVLRMARPLDRDRAAEVDPNLAELLEWATTVVRLPLKPSAINRLAKDLDAFPAEFALFSHHVGTVTLEDRRATKIVKRKISQEVNGGRRGLRLVRSSGSDVTEHWRVFARTHRPSATSLEEAGELHDRPEIELSWAVPDHIGEESRRSNRLGEFWAFFPTNYKTTARGIFNAPWKTSEDRQNLYSKNAFNDELIRIMANLVVDSLPSLTRVNDPCAHLDSMPARGREEPQWAAEDLVSKIWSIAAVKPTVPDQNGAFGTAAKVRFHPEGLRSDWLKLWADHPGRPENWCHHSVESTKQRRDSVNHILAAANISRASVCQWLEALVEDKIPDASARAIKIVAAMRRHDPLMAEQAMKAKIILTESHALVSPSDVVFRRSTSDGLADNTVYVAENVYADDPRVVRALDEIGIHEADYAGRFASVVERGFSVYTEREWVAFWQLSRLAGPAATLSGLRAGNIIASKALKLRTKSGEFRCIRDCLMPGKVVPADGSRDERIAVDLEFHSADKMILRDLGLQEGPVASIDPRDEAWFGEYVESRWKHYQRTLSKGEVSPSKTMMKIDGTNPAGPLHFLTELSPDGRAAFLGQLPQLGLVTRWTMQVGKKVETRRPVMSPLQWVARKSGFLETSKGLRRTIQCVGPQLRQHQSILPVANISEGLAETLGLPGNLSDLRASFWIELMEEVAKSEDDSFAGKAYALLFEAEAEWPEGATTRCRVGNEWRSDVEDGDIAVTASRAEYEVLVQEHLPALLAPTEQVAEQMREIWGMLSASDVIQRELRWVEQAEAVLLTEEFPHLKVLKRNQVEGWSLVRCSELEEVTRTPNGMRAESLPAAAQAHDHKIFVLRPENDHAALMEVDRVLKLGVGASGCRGVLERREQQRQNDRLRRAREVESPAEKLLELVGSEALKKGLPQGLLESEESEKGRAVGDRRIAELAHNAYGTESLRIYRKDIEANIPAAAVSFRGDTNSLRLVNEVGFSESYAGTKSETLNPVEIVGGPTAYPRLHDYQEKLAANMFDLLTRYSAPKAMLCMPTGAGKTRVAAEAVIRFIKEHGLGGRPVLWVAQSGELCEQAVQSWAFVWSKVGPEERLTINRLWESREATLVKETPQLVVATDAKLEVCLEKPEYAWLRDPVMVIVDEAHVSITPRYTKLLTWLGITHREANRPLVGLTATPFRGFNEEATRRLAERYGRYRLDEGVFTDDPYSELQELGVLARVEHRQLKGATFELSSEELEETLGFRGARLPRSVEERLGLDNERNRTLIGEIERLSPDSPVLLFATSVNHARMMAAMLNDRGIHAASIDSTTPDADRRTRIEGFRKRKVRVLTNFGVLAQGFDAPATEVVVVARPTYSPNIYQQMIGRGLRGPKNGGKETCLILDVADNIINYDKKLAFTDFEYLWSRR
ncbi:DEAD/DEAH box helicase [Streptosporangium sp. V21-05]|uniref:DEAD/DEAH box helicase n=1 Tax=Streptosporangium sp. V21-05 TaxID=3446115 RepID=UPI003F531EF5